MKPCRGNRRGRDGIPKGEPEFGCGSLSIGQAAERMGEVGKATWEAARSAGWSDRELADAFASIVANLFTNYFNHYVGTELHLPAAPALDRSS